MSREPDEDLPDEPLPGGPTAAWTFADVLSVFFLHIFWLSVAASTLLGTGLFEWAVPEAAILKTPPPTDEPEAARVVRKASEARVLLWATFLAAPFQIATVLLWFGLRYRTPLSAYGLGPAGWRRGLGLGLLGGVVGTPLVLGLHALVLLVYGWLVKAPAEEHALLLLVKQTKLLPIEWVFWFGVAVVVAPLTEELLFRGVLQGYLLAHPAGGYLVLLAALALAYAGNYSDIQAAPSGFERLDASMPVLFVLVLGLVYFALGGPAFGRGGPAASAAPAVFPTALLFASIHPTWPDPVALFALGLLLGFLRAWSGSLLAPIIVHALFNATSTVSVFVWGV